MSMTIASRSVISHSLPFVDVIISKKLYFTRNIIKHIGHRQNTKADYILNKNLYRGRRLGENNSDTLWLEFL